MKRATKVNNCSYREKQTSIVSNSGKDSAKTPSNRHFDIEKGSEAASDQTEIPWWQNRPLLMSLVVTAWMLSVAKYNDELGPIFVSAPIAQV